MVNFQELRKEIEKGCGKKLQYTHEDGTVHWKCGETETYNWMYCEVCQAKLETLNKCEEVFKEMIENRINLIKNVKRESDLIEQKICDAKLVELIKLLSQFNSYQNPTQRNGSISNGLGTSSGNTSQLKQEKEEKGK